MALRYNLDVEEAFYSAENVESLRNCFVNMLHDTMAKYVTSVSNQTKKQAKKLETDSMVTILAYMKLTYARNIENMVTYYTFDDILPKDDILNQLNYLTCKAATKDWQRVVCRSSVHCTQDLVGYRNPVDSRVLGTPTARTSELKLKASTARIFPNMFKRTSRCTE